ncbi:MAG: dihydrofolate reductase family protein, partial [Firmicutes bacterium]|nr:dihydrofolate reductase family protein [Bacillota bacterium]
DVRVFPADEQGRVPLTAMMNELGRRHITSVLVEGGSTLNYSLLTARLVDKIHFFVAPLIFGGESAATPVGGEGVATVAQAWRVINIESTHYETDLLVTGYIEYS